MVKYAGIFITMFVLLLIATSARAMCAYNKSESVVRVDLNCGTFCSTEWILNPGDKECRPGKGGKVYYQLIDYHDSDHGYRKAHVQVDEHGWTTTRGQGDGVELCSKRENGSIRECMEFK